MTLFNISLLCLISFAKISIYFRDWQAVFIIMKIYIKLIDIIVIISNLLIIFFLLILISNVFLPSNVTPLIKSD